MTSLKLNKTQITVLASEIYSELELEANKYKQTEEYINFEDSLKGTKAIKLYKELDKLLATFKTEEVSIDDYYLNRVLKGKQEYIDSERNKQFPKPSIPTKTTIENKIILATIDAEDLSSLIETVKESLKK